MKKYSKILALLIVLCMMVSMIGCQSAPAEPAEVPAATEAPAAPAATEAAAAPEAEKKPYNIGYSVGEFSFALCAQTAVLFEQECKARGLEYTVTDGEKDATKQIDDINALIQKGVDALLVLPTDGNAVAAGVEAAYDAGIPVFVILRNMPTVTDKFVAFSGTDDAEIGTLAGQWIVDAIGGKGKIAYISGTPGLSTAENRTVGFHSVVDQYPDIEIVAEQTGKYSRAEAMTVMEAILQANPEIDAVWCANDEMAGGVCQAIDAAGRTGILVGGANFQKDAYDRLMTGEQAADITTPPQMVISALDAAIDYLDGKPVEPTLLYPLDIITKDNADQFKDQLY